MNETLKKIKKKEMSDFIVEATLQVEKGNKAAGARSRKSSLVLRDLLKEWKAASVKGE